MNVIQTLTFSKQIKKLHKNQKTDLDQAVRALIEDPFLGDGKKGNLADVYVYKFSMAKERVLLAYQYDEGQDQLLLLAVGSHENFYRDLKK
jgi:mRNA interferase YafQ